MAPLVWTEHHLLCVTLQNFLPPASMTESTNGIFEPTLFIDTRDLTSGSTGDTASSPPYERPDARSSQVASRH
eukprot:4208988-Karenia_brevis.AAC.1